MSTKCSSSFILPQTFCKIEEFFFFLNFHFIVLSEKPIFLSVFKDLDFYMGFGGGCGAAPGGLNWSAGV